MLFKKRGSQHLTRPLDVARTYYVRPPSLSSPHPNVEKAAVVVCGTKVSHLLQAVAAGYLPSDPDWHFVYPERIRKDGSILGLSVSPEVYCYIDMEKANAAGISFVLAPDEGQDFDLQMISSGADGIPFSAIRRVIDNRAEFFGAIRYVDASDPDMAFMHKSGVVTRKVWHATYWDRLTHIQQDGLLPNQQNEFGLTLGNHVHLGIGDSVSKVKGLSRRPDVIFEIDPMDLSDAIALVPDQLDTLLVRCVTPMALRTVKPIVPFGMPDDLRGEVVDFTEIPLIDYSQSEDIIIEALRHAISVGFMQITNHGIPQELCDQCLDLGRRFFALPQEKKDKLRMTPGVSTRGYFGKGAENTDGLLDEAVQGPRGGIQTKRTDCKEGLDLKGCQGDGGGAKTKEGATFAAETPAWPDEDFPEMQRILGEYQDRVLEFSRRLLLAFAKALDLPDPEVLLRSVDKPVATHRLLHYWPLEDLKNEISIGAHCDYGLLTVLLQDGTGGLQVLNSEKDWVHCPPIHGSLVCNIGDILSRWTNNRCRSTIHRVVNISDVDRYSMPFFLEPSFGTRIDPTDLGLSPAAEVPTCEDILVDFYARAGLLQKA